MKISPQSFEQIQYVYSTQRLLQKAQLSGEKSLWNSLWANANKLTSIIFVYKSSPSSTLPLVIPDYIWIVLWIAVCIQYIWNSLYINADTLLVTLCA